MHHFFVPPDTFCPRTLSVGSISFNNTFSYPSVREAGAVACIATLSTRGPSAIDIFRVVISTVEHYGYMDGDGIRDR